MRWAILGQMRRKVQKPKISTSNMYLINDTKSTYAAVVSVYVTRIVREEEASGNTTVNTKCIAK